MRDLASGSRDALADLYDAHAASLFRHAMALTRRTADAEDLVATVFLKLATTGAELLGVRSPAAYLHRMVSTTWLDAQRRAAVADRHAPAAAADTPMPGVPGDSIDVTRALDALPAAQRQAVVLHVVEGFSFREVGRATGVSLFTAAARYRLAIARLRQILRRTT